MRVSAALGTLHAADCSQFLFCRFRPTLTAQRPESQWTHAHTNMLQPVHFKDVMSGSISALGGGGARAEVQYGSWDNHKTMEYSLSVR